MRHFLSAISSQLRNRFLAILFLLFCIAFLVYFDIQQGFTSWKAINSRLSIFIAINVNIVLLVVAFYLVLKNLLKLIFERNQQVLGFNLKTKLTIAFILISFPATLSHLFTTLFTSSTLDTWMERQYQLVSENSQSVSQEYYLNLKSLMASQGLMFENALQIQPGLLNDPARMLDLATRGDIEGLTVYDDQRNPIYQTLRTHKSNKYWKPMNAVDWEQVEAQTQAWLSEDLGNRLIYRHIRSFPVRDQLWRVEITHVFTKYLTKALNNLDEQEINNQIFNESEDLIRNYYIVSLLLMVVVIVFVATWFAFYMARGFVRPIEQLAEATQRVAEGELGYQVAAEKDMPLDRDFGQLVRSFNSMSYQLMENQEALESTANNLQKSNATLEEHSRFVELVLENIKTGVISMDTEGRVNVLNRSVKQLLQLKTGEYFRKHYREVLDEESLKVIEEMFDALYTSQRKSITQDLTVTKAEAPMNIAVTLLTLENRGNRAVGMILVFENITEIQRLHRARAWRDVARRIAHEIKNPLTPIQLSAQRIRRKYKDTIEQPRVLEQATQTIIDEVEMLKKMVKEFSSFARLPESTLQSEDLNATIEDAIQLYQNALPDNVQLTMDLDPQLPQFALDREQMKRVFVNLIDNALVAVEEQGEVSVSTHFDKDLRMVRAEVVDNGPGVPLEIRQRLFEPYITTKKHGTGLGLTIVAQIISDHNGFIRHQPLESGGSRFSIELPFAS